MKKKIEDGEKNDDIFAVNRFINKKYGSMWIELRERKRKNSVFDNYLIFHEREREKNEY